MKALAAAVLGFVLGWIVREFNEDRFDWLPTDDDPFTEHAEHRVCRELSVYGYRCTRRIWHTGPHAAKGTGNELLDSWSEPSTWD